MTRKAITTSHTVVACDVCGRNLLRGERAETFIAGGSRRTVCELCTARAVHEGWLREGLDDVGVRRNGQRRSGSLLGRLRARRDAYLARSEEEPPEMAHERYQRSHERRTAEAPAPAPREVHAVPTNAELKMARALEVFNASEHRRTVGGVARSLGEPAVTIRPSPTEGAVVSVIVAWELTWYRFEVDLANEAAGVRVAHQGTELAELDDAERQPNAVAQPDGTLALVS